MTRSKRILLSISLGITVILGFTLTGATASAKKDQVVLTTYNTVTLSSQVDDESVTKVFAEASALHEMLPDDDVIYLVLNTPGGSIDAGLELIDNLKSLNRTIKPICIFCASMGFQIFQNLNERLMVNRGELMSHKARGGFGPLEFGGKEPSQTTNRISHWTKRVNQLDVTTVQRTKGKQTLASYQDAYDNELWLSSGEAIKGGYADQVVNVVCDSTLAGVRTQEVDYMGLAITLTFSKCPIVTGLLGVEINIKTRNGTTVRLDNYLKLGGEFGNACFTHQITKLCPQDITLTLDRIEVIKNQTIKKYKVNRDNLIYY